MSHNLYWGDLHSHCSISYGEGTVEQAFARARDQLDFCSITGHAFWPDMPTDRQRYGEIIDYHREGFARLAGNWDELLAASEQVSQEGEFLAIPSYEWHSLKYGDHNVYALGPELPLRDAPDLPALRAIAAAAGAIIIPHHIGYAAGYRGIDWDHFDSSASPFVEIYSMHGCSESEEAPLPMFHDMGPRDFGSTAVAGWQAGHRFGVIGSTDHHGGYPGSHGDGRLAVYADALTRRGLWEALISRRVNAVTGDKIDARLFVNDAWIGAEIHAPGPRNLRIRVNGTARLDRVELLKNDRVLETLFAKARPEQAECFRLRITWGWGRQDEVAQWDCQAQLSAGQITVVEPCFSGQSIVAPRGVGGHTQAADDVEKPHQIIEQTDRTVAWRSVTTGNRSTRHPTVQALSLELAAPLQTTFSLVVNDQRIEYRLEELLDRGHATYLRGWLSEAIRVGPLDPITSCQVHEELTDNDPGPCDRYRLRVQQTNGQCAWTSPVWAES